MTRALWISMALLVAALGCAPRVQTAATPQIVGNHGDSAANQAALEQLASRGGGAPANQSATLETTHELPILPVSVVEPPPTAAELGEGHIRRSDLRDFLESGPPALLAAIDVEPAMDGEAFLGFRVASFDPAVEAFQDSGLRPGDVVTTVNGVAISDPEGFMRVWDSMGAADHLNVDIIRQGHARTLAWDIE